jgi:asparagine synthase (glutamine-hydrolysing)
MCGITGKIYFDHQHPVDLKELRRMTDVIRHRGPDDEGHFVDQNVGLGFRRLSIIDLSTGHQPLQDSSGRYWITFNGEVYNYVEERKELKKKGYVFKTNTDTEVIVNLYAEYQEKCLGHLRGMFAFVIWDTQKKVLFGARDRFGIKPFHYYIDNQKFVWGSEIKSILTSSDIDKTTSLEALDYYFAYGYTPREQSIYQNIKKLKPGHYFYCYPLEDNKISIEKYWDINFQPDYSKSEDYWKEKIYTTLEEAVKLRMRSDVPLGAFLSGGIDSSTVVALMARNSYQPIKTFSIGFKEEKFNELQYARQVANMYQTDHHEMIVEPESIDLLPKLVSAYDEPFADSSAIPTYYVSKFTREYVTVALSGDGGDELFAGYNSYPKMLNLKNAFYNNRFTNKAFFKPLNRIIPDYVYGKGYTYFLSKDKNMINAWFCFWKDYERQKIFTKEIQKQLQKNNPENYKEKLIQSIDGDFLSKMQGLDMKTYMVDDILTKVDRATMLNSLEARVPILDHRFAELSFQIPIQFKLNGSSKKHILKESFRHILPREILSHKKQGFGVPLSVWFKGDLKQYAFDTLLNSSKIDTYLDKKRVSIILKYHQKGMRDYSAKIWSLLFLNEWMKQNP